MRHKIARPSDSIELRKRKLHQMLQQSIVVTKESIVSFIHAVKLTGMQCFGLQRK